MGESTLITIVAISQFWVNFAELSLMLKWISFSVKEVIVRLGRTITGGGSTRNSIKTELSRFVAHYYLNFITHQSYWFFNMRSWSRSPLSLGALSLHIIASQHSKQSNKFNTLSLLREQRQPRPFSYSHVFLTIIFTEDARFVGSVLTSSKNQYFAAPFDLKMFRIFTR